MTRNPSEPHAGRSAELQRLLEEAANAHLPTTTEQVTEADEPHPATSVKPPARHIHGRTPLVGVGRSVRLAAERSSRQQRRRGARAAATQPGHSSRQLPVSRRTGISVGAARWRSTTSRLFKNRQADEVAAPTPLPPSPPTDYRTRTVVGHDTGFGSSPGRQVSPPPRRTRQRAFVLAAGMAAAVIAVVAIAVGSRVAAAPTSDGSPPAPTTSVSTIGTSSSGAPSRVEVAGISQAGVGPDGSAGPVETSSTQDPTTQDPTTQDPTTQDPAAQIPVNEPTSPNPGSGETATVVTGVSKLSGWVTNIAPLTAPQG